MDEELENTIPEEVVNEAKTMGWVPLDKFKGNKDRWVDADEFVERGKVIVPILLNNNKRLQQELLTRDQKIDTLNAALQNNEAAIQRLEKHYSEANKIAVATARKELQAELKEARENGDVEAEDRILGNLEDLRAREKAATKEQEEDKTAAKKDPPDPNSALSPELREWMTENPWYGQDKQKTKAFNRLSEDLRDEGVTLTGRAFLDEALTKFEELQNDDGDAGKQTRPSAKVESGSGRGARSGGKSFADLPAEAKQACHQDTEALVGPGKMFKTQKEWETHYANMYFGEG